MTISQSIELFVAINLLVVGASHLFQPKIWVQFFQLLHRIGHPGNMFNAMLSLGMGSLVLSLHWIWIWPMVLVTVYGLLLTLKGTIYLILPSIGLKSIGQIDAGSNYKFQIAGAIMMTAGILLLIYLLRVGALSI